MSHPDIHATMKAYAIPAATGFFNLDVQDPAQALKAGIDEGVPVIWFAEDQRYVGETVERRFLVSAKGETWVLDGGERLISLGVVQLPVTGGGEVDVEYFVFEIVQAVNVTGGSGPLLTSPSP